MGKGCISLKIYKHFLIPNPTLFWTFIRQRIEAPPLLVEFLCFPHLSTQKCSVGLKKPQRIHLKMV